MIQEKNNVFVLSNEQFSYLLRVTDEGRLEHLHFGGPASAEDADALTCQYGLGWGGTVCEKGCQSPETRPMEWSGSGRGDYRETPLEREDGSTDFRYIGYEILPSVVPMQGELPQAQGPAETLQIRMEDTAARLRLTLYWTVFDTAVTRRAVVTNIGETPQVLRKCMSTCMDLNGVYEMTTLNGSWSAEAQRWTAPVGPSRLVNESTVGFSSAQHNPGFMLSEPDATEEAGRVFGFNLIYSGNHYASAQRSFHGLTRVMQGISPDHFRWALAPGESFETPEAVMTFSAAGFNGMSKAMHRFINEHIVPEAWRYRPRPVLYNSWEGCLFDFTQGRLLKLARKARDLGCELFVLDDGWFGRRKDDTAGLGDYDVNKKKLPDGLEGLAREVRKLGMDFGLWFEPEAVNEDSALFEAHPDWAMTEPDRETLYGRNELLLDLTKEPVRDYIVESVGHILDTVPISYVKWDMNRNSAALGAKAHRYILGLYDVLRRIFGPRPQVLLESCSSGGNRFDLGMMCFSPQVWTSDDTDPVERRRIQQDVSYLYPLSVMGAHVSASPNVQTLRDTPLFTRGNTAFFGVLGYELDLQDLLPTEEKEIRAQIEFYKTYREVFQYGSFRRLKTAEGYAWQVSRTEPECHIAAVFHDLVHAGPGYETLRMTGLEADRRYRITSRPQRLRVGRFGALVKHIAPIPVSLNGMVLRMADRHYEMMDGEQTDEASGGALMAGWQLASRFTGTGYNPSLRVQGDFGSNVYVAEPIEKTIQKTEETV